MLLMALIKYGKNDIDELDMLIDRVVNTFNDKMFIGRLASTDYDWVGICSNEEVLNVIEDFLYSL